MIEFLRTWITSVVVTVIFIVLVDMIMPENNLKKYAKLVTGLIVIVTMLSPIFKIFDNNSDIQTYISKYTTYSADKDKSKGKVQEEFQNRTMEVFSDNLKKKIEQDIYSETGEKYIVAKLDIVNEWTNSQFADIKYIELKADNKKVTKVDKIVINNNPQNVAQLKNNKVVKLLKDNFGISEKSVRFIR